MPDSRMKESRFYPSYRSEFCNETMRLHELTMPILSSLMAIRGSGRCWYGAHLAIDALQEDGEMQRQGQRELLGVRVRDLRRDLVLFQQAVESAATDAEQTGNASLVSFFASHQLSNMDSLD